MSTKAYINQAMLSWAIDKSQLSTTAIAQKLGQSEEKLTKWETGLEKPTFTQAQKLAALLKVPFGYFFLNQPPEEQLPIPDLRTIADRDLQKPSQDLRDIIYQVIKKQSWYIDYLKENDAEPLSYVGKFNIKSDIRVVANDMRQTIKVPLPTSGSAEEYFSKLLNGIENTGVLVMRAGIVGNNTRRKLLVTEFRGFAITDQYAPVIFINSSDAPSARLFTLLHELVHIWIGASGISSISTSEKRQEEVYCNYVAAEFLVPGERIRELWSTNDNVDINLGKVTKEFHVSKIAAARKALQEKLISEDVYWQVYNTDRRIFLDKNSESDGGNFYNAAIVKNSKPFSKAIVREALRGKLLIRDAGQLLGISPAKLREYASMLTT